MPRKKGARKRAATKASRRKDSTPHPEYPAYDPFVNVPGNFPNYPSEYSSVRSTKDLSELSARNNPETMKKLGDLVEAFQKKEDPEEENGEK